MYLKYKKEWADGKQTGKETLTKFWDSPEKQAFMISKVAEALVLRKTWPGSFAGVLTAEEVGRTSESLGDEPAIEAKSSVSFEDLLQKKNMAPAGVQSINAYLEYLRTFNPSMTTEELSRNGLRDLFSEMAGMGQESRRSENPDKDERKGTANRKDGRMPERREQEDSGRLRGLQFKRGMPSS
jgi:hypothetical protein